MREYQGNKIQFDLGNTNFWISNHTMYLNQPFQVLDTNTPNVVKTRNSEMEIDLVQIKENYVKELDTLRNITTYSSSSPLSIDGLINRKNSRRFSNRLNNTIFRSC